jgi:hypothetical protein
LAGFQFTAEKPEAFVINASPRARLFAVPKLVAERTAGKKIKIIHSEKIKKFTLVFDFILILP